MNITNLPPQKQNYHCTDSELKVVYDAITSGVRESQLYSVLHMSKATLNRRLGKLEAEKNPHFLDERLVATIDAAKADLSAKVISKLTQLGIEQNSVEALKFLAERVCGFTKTTETKVEANIGYTPTLQLNFTLSDGEKCTSEEYSEFKAWKNMKDVTNRLPIPNEDDDCSDAAYKKALVEAGL